MLQCRRKESLHLQQTQQKQSWRLLGMQARRILLAQVRRRRPKEAPVLVVPMARPWKRLQSTKLHVVERKGTRTRQASVRKGRLPTFKWETKTRRQAPMHMHLSRPPALRIAQPIAIVPQPLLRLRRTKRS